MFYETVLFVVSEIHLGNCVSFLCLLGVGFQESTRSGLHLEAGSGHELFEDGLKIGVNLLVERSLNADGVGDVGVLGLQVVEVHNLELLDLGSLEVIKETSDTGVQDADLLFSGHGDVLLLLEELGELLTSVEELLGGGIKIGTELGEGGDFSVLGKLELEGTSDLLHGLDLGGGTDTGHGETDVNGGTDTLVEELSLEEDLTVSDGDNVGGDVSGHITSLGLNDGEGSQGAGTVVLVHLSCTLEETGMKIENITGVSLTTRGSSEEEGHLTVSNSLLGEIVVDDKGVLGVVTEVLTNGASGVRSQELEGSGLGGGGSNDDGVLEGVSLVEESNDVGDGGSLLADSDVDAVEGLGVVTGLEGSLLVEDSVNGNSGLASLSISNNELTLASANGHLYNLLLISYTI